MINSIKVVSALLATTATAEQLTPPLGGLEQADRPVPDSPQEKGKYLKGPCPELVGTMSSRKDFIFEHQRMHGRWKAAYESKQRMRGMKCLQLKFLPVEGGQPHQLQGLAGQKIISQEGDFTGGQLFKDGTPGFFYDEESYFNFGHPEKPGLAAMQTREDLFDIDRSKMRAHITDQMRELTYEEKERMMPDEVQRYEDTKKYIEENLEKIMQDVDNYDPFALSYEILDTDYDNFMIMYTCKSFAEQVNAEGQSQSTIEEMKRQDIQKKLMVGEQAKKTIHMFLQTMGGNKKFTKFVQIIQQQLANEHAEEARPLTDAQLRKELKFFLDCDPSLKQLFYNEEPTLEAWKKVRVFFDYHLQQEMEAGMDAHADFPDGVPISDAADSFSQMKYMDATPAFDVQFDDLPKYDEEYSTEQFHQLSLSVFVRNLEQTTDDAFDQYLNKVKSMVPAHDPKTSDHVRIMHDKDDCPAEDEDPFLMADSQSYTTALGIEVTNPMADVRPQEDDIYNNFYDLDPDDLDGFGATGLDNETREL